MISLLFIFLLGSISKKPLSRVSSIFTRSLDTDLSPDGSPVPLKAPKPVRVQHYPGELWFREQHVDHFDSTNTKKWSQRYYYNDTYYKAGGPSFS